ncbi:MAG: gliding motility-associated protein GldE [Pseudoflavonifractor sp.]|nr:gliding motility-associated protein GldE [Pseudoflavonifractor sp.]
MDIDPLPATSPMTGMILASINDLLTVNTPSAASITALILAVIALLISGFVSGSEIAYFSLTPAQCETLDQGSKGAKVRELLGMPERLLATILITNNLVNVTIVVLCNFAFSQIFQFHAGSEILSFLFYTVILTFIILLFGEILPKLYARTYTTQWASMATGGLRAAVALFKPLSSVLVHSSSIVNRVVTKKAENISTDELSRALEITDLKTPDDKEMLEGILKFGDTTASEIMTPRVDIIDIDITSDFDEVMALVLDKGYSRMPVYEDTQDNIKGILYSRDLLPYIGKKLDGFRWQSLLREPYFVPESRMIDDLLEDFRRMKIHLAIVIDEFGGTQGLVTMEDVLEEIVGDINDEYDDEETGYKRLPDDTYIFEGKTLLNDFFKITGLDEDDYLPVAEDCETLAGMLLAIKGDFPKEKESIVYGRCRFLVLDIERHRIASVRVKVMPDVQQPTPTTTRP